MSLVTVFLNNSGFPIGHCTQGEEQEWIVGNPETAIDYSDNHISTTDQWQKWEEHLENSGENKDQTPYKDYIAGLEL